MATYFNRFFIEFEDSHYVNPIMYRIDIMDSEGGTPTNPIQLQASGTPLITTIVTENESKDAAIIGSEITISYLYTGDPNEPLPVLFFDTNERRFRVEIRKDGVLDNVYYLKPDFSSYPYLAAPFDVQLKAVDGLSYAKSVLFNVYGDDQLLKYDKISWYEAIMTRALLLIVDADTKINVLNSLYPTNIATGVKLLFGCFIHTDIVYDFVTGAQKVRDVLFMFAKALYARIFIEHNQIWFIRSQDLTFPTFTVEQYISSTVVNDVPMPDMIRTIGPSSAYDGEPVGMDGEVSVQPAIKEAEYEVTYKGINLLSNFDWSIFDGTDFANWVRKDALPTGIGIVVSRTGTGTIADPYMLYIPFDQPPSGLKYLQQIVSSITGAGGIFEISFQYEIFNCKSFALFVRAGNVLTPDQRFVLDSSGAWIFDGGETATLGIAKAGKKTKGSFTFKSFPLPTSFPDGSTVPSVADVELSIFQPREETTDDGPGPAYIKIGRIKIGGITASAIGRRLIIKNGADFSQVKDSEEFTFIDTGENGLSNTIFTGASLLPVDDWDSAKTAVEPGDIEQHMAKAVIDQYRKSPYTFEGTIYSNSLSYFNLLEFLHLPGRRFMQLTRTVDHQQCEIKTLAAEVLEEGAAIVNYEEFDIDEEKD